MRRTLTFLALGLVVVVVALLGIDTGFAISAERSFARALGSYNADFRYEPEVTISGFPAMRSVADGRYSAIGITARAVGVTGAGTCTEATPCHADLRSRLTDVRILGPERSFQRTTTLSAGSVSGSVTLDSVAVGRLMDIHDLTVNTPAPKGTVGGGGPQDGLLSRTNGILLTGSVSPGTDRPVIKVSVSADLSVAEGRLRLRATDFYRGPEEHVEADVPTSDRANVLAAFSQILPDLPTPWGQRVTSVRSSGSDLMLEVAPGTNASLSMSTFAVLIPDEDVFGMYTDPQPR